MMMSTVDEYGVKNYNPLIILFPTLLTYAIIVVGAAAWLSYYESGAANTTLHSFGDCVWLAVMASSTVGFGDVYPVTTEGRVITGSMFFVGMLLIGVIVGTMSKWVDGITDNSVQNRELRSNQMKDLQNAEEIKNLLKELKEKQT
jgi:hypothetical protein